MPKAFPTLFTATGDVTKVITKNLL
jgi:hypothetical protein